MVTQMIKPTSKTVGILGGMGPYATLSFYEMLLKLTPVTKDWDHLRVILDVNPHIPSRSRHHHYGEPSPIPAMIDSCRRLESYPVDFIVIPCNSASYFLPEVQKAVHVPILNIMQVTVDAVVHQLPLIRRVAVIGGVITWEHCTYEPFLKAKGLSYVHYPATIQRQVERLIEQIKINAPKEAVLGKFYKLIHSIHVDHAVDAIILGCTEFGCLGHVAADVPLIDSSRELALATVKFGLT